MSKPRSKAEQKWWYELFEMKLPQYRTHRGAGKRWVKRMLSKARRRVPIDG